MVATVKFLIFSYGKIVDGEEGKSYDGDPIGKIRLQTDASYNDLLSAICTKMKLDLSAHKIEVIHRHPKFVRERVHYYKVPIDDDSDVQDLIEMAEDKSQGSIQELYIEISDTSTALSEHMTRQAGATSPSTSQVLPSKRSLTTGNEDFMPKRPRNEIDSSKDVNDIEPEINRVREDSPTETRERVPYKSCEGDQASRASSSSTPPPGQNYEVFLSFRGIDTRHGFTDHLYKRLVKEGVWTFRDKEEIPVGKGIGPEILQAIKGSKISVLIISKNYASSPWCLMELVEILTCKERLNQVVLPIFHHVKPSEVRNQTGDFGIGFDECKNQRDVEGKDVQEWINALKVVSDLHGLESSKISDGHETGLLEEVVKRVLQELETKTLRVDPYLVGVESHGDEIITKINKECSGVQAILVHGMSGIGKTTLAKVVFNRLFNSFERCSFIADIREKSQRKGMEKLQEQLILDILGEQKDVQNIDNGANIIKARCEGKKVLVLLDDVDHRDQLKALAGEPNWFGRGSVIIITSRNKDVLEKGEFLFFYELRSLDDNESLLLLKNHAFREDDPRLDEYGTLAEGIVKTTGGLPLAIEIIGGHLHNKPKEIWQQTLEMLKDMPHDDVQRKLKISFDALDPDEQEIFLDIACLPILEDREAAINMWVGCGFHKQRINNLVSRSMIKYGHKNDLLIHDQLRDLGRAIVKKSQKGWLGNCSRLWKTEDARHVLESKQGTPEVQALSFGFRRGEDAHYTSQQFERMTRLRFLHMQGVQLTGNFENLFLNLRWLWWDCAFSGCIDIIGINFKPKSLVVLKLSNCNVTEHWTGWSEMKYLKVLELRNCHELKTALDFSAMEELDVLVLSNCHNSREIDSSIGKLSKSLKVLDVSHCRKLKELPKEVGKMEELRKLDILRTSVREIPIFEGYLTKLETLSARVCYMLTKLPKSIGKLKLLTKLNLMGTRVTQLPDSVGDLYNLEELSMSNSKIECLPTSIGNLHKLLKELRLGDCKELREIPESIGKLKLLTELDLRSSCVTQLPNSVGDLYNLEQLFMSGSKIECLPTSIGNLDKLQILHLDNCQELRIPEFIGKLKLLTVLDLSCICVTQLPDSVGDLCNLEVLLMYGSKIECLPTSIGNLNKLQYWDLGDCKELREIPESIGKLQLLTYLDLSSTRVTQLPDSVGDLNNLKELSMSGSKIECLPTSIGNLHKLPKLDLRNCQELREIPESIGKLKLLTELDLSSSCVIQLPDSVGDLCNLEGLFMCGSKIECLPTSIGNLHKLQCLDLSNCKELREIPESIGNLKSLTELDLRSTCFTQLPYSVGDLYNLEELSLSGSKIECLPTSIGNLRKLQKLDLGNYEELREIPKSIGKLQLLTKLDLRSTRVTQLLDSVGDLYNLEELSMSGSKIECLPTSIGNLQK